MEESVVEYEQKRDVLIDSLKALGDFRRGTVTVNYRKCGKPNCVCAQPGRPGHGPQYLWSATIRGKSYAKNLKLGPQMQKYEEETARHRRFVEVCDEIVRVNERICDLRPVPEARDDQELAELKKKLQRRFAKKYKVRTTEIAERREAHALTPVYDSRGSKGTSDWRRGRLSRSIYQGNHGTPGKSGGQMKDHVPFQERILKALESEDWRNRDQVHGARDPKEKSGKWKGTPGSGHGK